MRTLYFSCLILFLFCSGFSQNFYNGSFEINTADSCLPQLYNSQFNAAMSYVKAFGNFNNGGSLPTGRTSIDSACSVVPPDGNWCVGLRGNFDQSEDAIALQLDAPLDSGTTYYVSFYCYGNISFHNFECDLELGSSLSYYSFGTPHYTVTANYLTWKKCNFSFVALDTSRYITVRAVPAYNSWIQVDNFAITTTPDLVGLSTTTFDSNLNIYPNPVSDNLIVSLGNTEEPTKLELYNSLDLPVLQKMSQSKTQNLDVSDLGEGIYTLRISNNKSSTCKKIIVAR